jgi:hypothetical protein
MLPCFDIIKQIKKKKTVTLFQLQIFGEGNKRCV